MRSFVALCRRRSNCFARAIGCGFVSVDGRAASLAQSIVGLLPRMAGVWLRDPRRSRVDLRFAQQILGSDVCVRNPRIIAP